MFLEIFFIFTLATIFFLAWGVKVKDGMIFCFGCILVICLGLMLNATGLTTNTQTGIITTKTTVDGNTTYNTVATYQNITVADDKALWAISYAMMILGILFIPAGYTMLKPKTTY